VQVQVDAFFDAAGKHAGETISLCLGLAVVVPAQRAFRRGVPYQKLETVCGKCGERLRSWQMSRLVHDHQTEPTAFLECSCLSVAYWPAKFRPEQITPLWKDLRLLQNRALSQYRAGQKEN
jgi:hypothetical protein